ncbi:adenosine deaminase AGSA-like [Anopheles nili]|uniref:adenosine deaminase AGSA-like n=1 Tax=Anopheles nili TaxID=185578 RepID=UPI00237B9CA1|nr:adenosine deaminase AGSA-like [Anopheles nili]
MTSAKKSATLRVARRSSSFGMLLVCCLLALFVTPEANTIIERPSRPSPEAYWYQRAQLASKEAGLALGADIQLTPEESLVNNHLMELKRNELESGFDNPYSFAPSRHFFEVLEQINKSPLFRFIRTMPKGAVLHAHDTALASTAVIVNATYQDHLWQKGNFTSDQDPEFRFSRSIPSNGDGWELVRSVRARTGSDRYDEQIERLFSLYEPDPNSVYRSINDVWNRFARLFLALEPIVTYRPVWETYFREALREFHEDNVMYLEFRGLLPTLYDLDGNTYTPEEVIEIYQKVTKEFKDTHPRFAGTKFIYAPLRFADNKTVEQYINLAEQLHLQYGDYVVGFDLVGQEDTGPPLKNFIDQLLSLPSSINFLFHAGETNWHGMPTDENLLDAVMLGTKRIGHGYALLKHPILMERVWRRGICIEINPVSNQVLKLVADNRNHPASVLFTHDFPVVVSSDDPSFWRASPLSHDFYIAFLGIASAHQDLRLLKKLALNSLQYSLMSEREKAAAEAMFHESWDEFIHSQVRLLSSERSNRTRV